MNYTVIGDNVNVAARLYNVAKGGEIIISETTLRRVPRDSSRSKRSSPLPSRAKSLPIAAYDGQTRSTMRSVAVQARALLLFALALFRQRVRRDGRIGRRVHPRARAASVLRTRTGRGGRHVADAHRRQRRQRRGAYLLQRRVHVKIGLLVAAGGLPGGIIGAVLSLHIRPALRLDAFAAADRGRRRHGLERREAYARAARARARARDQRHVVSRRAALGLRRRPFFESVRPGRRHHDSCRRCCTFPSCRSTRSRDVAVWHSADVAGRIGRARVPARHRPARRRSAGRRRAARRPDRRAPFVARTEIAAAVAVRRRVWLVGRRRLADLAPLDERGAPAARRSAPSIFASRAFRQYFVGQSLSLLGDGLRMLAVPLARLSFDAFRARRPARRSSARSCRSRSSRWSADRSPIVSTAASS